MINSLMTSIFSSQLKPSHRNFFQEKKYSTIQHKSDLLFCALAFLSLQVLTDTDILLINIADTSDSLTSEPLAKRGLQVQISGMTSFSILWKTKNGSAGLTVLPR